MKAHRVVRCQGSHIFFRQSAHRWRKVVSLTHRASFTPQEDFWYSYLLEAESTPRPHSAAVRIRSIERSSDHIGNRTHDLPACSIVSQPITLPRAPYREYKTWESVAKKIRHIYNLEARKPILVVIRARATCPVGEVSSCPGSPGL
jgi:hypothetical protein